MNPLKSFRITFGIIAAILLLTSYLAYNSLNNMIDDAQAVAHTNVVMRELEKIESVVKDAETAHRGYQLTGDSTYLEPYYNSKWVAISKIDMIDSLIIDNPAQQQRLDSLRAGVVRQYDIIEKIILDMQNKDDFETKESSLLKIGNENMIMIRRLIDNMADEEWRLLRRRTTRQDYSSMVTPLLIFLSFIFAIIAVTYLFTQLYKTLRVKVVTENELEQNLKQISQEVNEKMRARESLRKVLDSSPNGILFMEAIRENGKIIDFKPVLGNKGVERHLHRSLDDILGGRLLELFPGNIASGSFKRYVKTTETGESSNQEFYYHDDKLEGWFEVSAVKLEDGCVITFVDTTLHKKAAKIIEESQQKFEAIFNNTFQFISLLDNKGVVLDTNETTYQYSKATADDIIGKNLWEMSWWANSHNVQKDLRLAIEKAKNGEFVRYETDIFDENAEKTPIDFSLKPIKDGDEVKLIIFEGRDISKIKEADEERAFVAQLNLTIANSNSFDEAVTSIFEQISTQFNMDYSEVWLPYDDQLYLSEIYYATEHKLGELHDQNIDIDIRKGAGIIGRVMNSFEMEYIEDLNKVSEDQFVSGHQALAYGLSTVFAVPILFNNDLVLAALFFSRKKIGHIDGLVRTIQQISSSIGALLIKKQTQDELERNNKLLATAEDIANMGSWEWHLSQDKVKWSEGAYNIYNKSPTTFTPAPSSFFDYIYDEDVERIRAEIDQSIQNKKGYDLNFRIQLDGGEIKHLRALATVELDEDKDVENFIGILQDITQQKTFEYNLLVKNEELIKSNENLEQFAYVASHDLQEPLRKIRAFGDRLVTKYQEVIDERGMDYISRMQGAAERMQALIDDLLKYSKVARNMEPFKRIDLNDLINEVILDLETRITETNTKIEIEKLPKIEANALQLRQLFQNIISNAIKFTPEDRTPLVKIHGKWLKGGYAQKKYDINANSFKHFVEIRISDNGVGFDQKYTDRIFNIFERLHGRNQFQGTGIGLAICQKVVQNHHGIIRADSVLNEGTTFTIVLPIKRNNKNGGDS